jgi:hypothetical protein
MTRTTARLAPRLAARTVLALALVLPTLALAWSRRVTSPPDVMIADERARLVTAVLRPAHYGGFADILQLSPRNGSVRWRHRWRGRGPEHSDRVSALCRGVTAALSRPGRC